MTESAKFAQTVPVSDETLAMTAETADAINRWMRATPVERAAWAREAERQRASVRASTPVVALNLDTLIANLGWSREYAEHFVQPYCDCEEDRYGGWEYCQHARDLELTR